MNIDDSYRKRIDAAGTAAGQSDEGWNTRFRKGLAAQGLALEVFTGQALKADIVMAPVPFGCSEAWPDSVIVDALPVGNSSPLPN